MTGTPEGPDPWESERRRLVASEIRAWMGRRRWSQAALADAIGRSEMYVSRGLRGLRPFSTDDLFRIADALDVSADVFLHVKRVDGVTGRQPPRPPVAVRATRRTRVKAEANGQRSTRRRPATHEKSASVASVYHLSAKAA